MTDRLEAQAMPRPWGLGGESDDEGTKIVSAKGTNPMPGDSDECEWIATVYDTTSAGPGPNAALIVRAVNSLDALVEALEALGHGADSGCVIEDCLGCDALAAVLEVKE